MLKYMIEYLVEYSSKSCLIYYDRIMNLIVSSNYSIVSGNHYHHTYVLVISVACIVTCVLEHLRHLVTYQSLLVTFIKTVVTKTVCNFKKEA